MIGRDSDTSSHSRNCIGIRRCPTWRQDSWDRGRGYLPSMQSQMSDGTASGTGNRRVECRVLCCSLPRSARCRRQAVSFQPRMAGTDPDIRRRVVKAYGYRTVCQHVSFDILTGDTAHLTGMFHRPKHSRSYFHFLPPLRALSLGQSSSHLAEPRSALLPRLSI